MGNTPKTTPTVTGALKFTAKEISMIATVLRLNSFNVGQNGMPDQYYPEKLDELTALETFKEIKKAIV